VGEGFGRNLQKGIFRQLQGIWGREKALGGKGGKQKKLQGEIQVSVQGQLQNLKENTLTTRLQKRQNNFWEKRYVL